MTFPMFDHLRMLSEVMTASVVVLGFVSLLICFRLLVASMPVKVPLAAA